MIRTLIRTTAVVCLAAVIFPSAAGVSAEEAPQTPPPRMTGSMLEELIREAATDFRIENTVMEFKYRDVAMACIFDRAQNRMRIVAPITAVSEVSPKEIGIILEANFHTALDGRYATSNGVLYAAYIHPLSMLQPKEVHSALRQVASLVSTFGTSYTSGELIFGGSDGPQGPDA
jgi:hypothetical protein